MQTSVHSSPENHCYCGSTLAFDTCCRPFINGSKICHNAEVLMRSRYSAYATKQYSYIVQTYGQAQRCDLKLDELIKADENSHWLKLVVLGASEQKANAQVEFRAYYRIDGQPKNIFYTLHELSDFALEGGQWRYTTGEIFKDSGPYKPERNESCLCASGKKYKKCCGL